MWAAMAPKMLNQADRLDTLATALQMPVLVVVGEQDRPFLGPSERMAKAVTGARLVVIPDAGHSQSEVNGPAMSKNEFRSAVDGDTPDGVLSLDSIIQTGARRPAAINCWRACVHNDLRNQNRNRNRTAARFTFQLPPLTD